MGKQRIEQREIQVATTDGVGKQLEQTYTVDDNCLPSPQELASYQAIDPQIVNCLIEVSKREQIHRHNMDNEKVGLVKRADERDGRMNWWGMFFAFLSIVSLCILSAFALYLDKPWFAGIVGLGTLASVASVFVRGSDSKSNKK
ncbi:putative membrane protein [Bacteroidales bacterium Barb6XT]|nr:putative membrane protein [Bacteroidales bacterium Barb6XT]